MTEEQNKLDKEHEFKLPFRWDSYDGVVRDSENWAITPQVLMDFANRAEREPATKAVLVPRDALILWACYLEDADSRLGPYLLGAKRDTSYKEAAEEIRLRLAGTFSCPHCGITTPHEHSVDRKGNALKGKGASQGAGELGRVLQSFAKGRCHACGWPLCGSATEGCVPFNCSYRPSQGPEHDTWLERAHEMERVLAVSPDEQKG